ncbi:hypothetical protein BDAP_001304, partial [Binucleata daphniae]
YVTPKFSVLPVPLEMTDYLLEEMLANNDKNNEYVKSASSDLHKVTNNGFAYILHLQKSMEKNLRHLLNTVPSLKLSTEEIYTYCENTKLYFIEAIYKTLNETNINAFYFDNLHITYNYMQTLFTRYRNMDQGILIGVLHILNEIYNPSIEDEKVRRCLYSLQKRLKDAWIRKIVTDYIQNNHNQIDTTDLRIILYKADLDVYYDKQKINKAFNEINDTIKKEKLDEGYILLEPAFYLHSESSLTYNDDKTKKETIDKKFLTYQYNTGEINTSFVDSGEAEKWRIIVRLDYEEENIKKYINYEHINNKDAIFDHYKLIINKHLEYIYNTLIKLTTTKIIYNPKITYLSFHFLKSQTHDTLHVDDKQPKTKQEASGTQN